MCLCSRDGNTKLGAPGPGPSKHSQNGRGSCPERPGAGCLRRARRGVGTWPSRYLPGLLRRLISARLRLSAPFPCPLSPQPGVRVGVRSGLAVDDGENLPKPGPQSSERQRQVSCCLPLLPGAACWLPRSCDGDIFGEIKNKVVVFFFLNYEMNMVGGVSKINVLRYSADRRVPGSKDMELM